jgi:hypothetical protein
VRIFLQDCTPLWSCGSVARIPGYKSRGPNSIPGATRFSEKWCVWNGVHWASSVQLRRNLEENVAAPVYKSEVTAVRVCHAGHMAPSFRKFHTNFADKWLSFGLYSSLAEQGNGAFQRKPNTFVFTNQLHLAHQNLFHTTHIYILIYIYIYIYDS